MARNIRVRDIRRKEIDEDKLALAFLLLAKILHEQEIENKTASGPVADDCPIDPNDDQPEAA